MLARWTIRFLLWLLYTKAERLIFRSIARSVSTDEGIPIYGKDQPRFGRDARRDRAVEMSQEVLPWLQDSKRNLGCELTYWSMK